ncbi:MAG: hypothetical protein ACJ8EF_18385 [Bradyrhizobium sp.]|jgi:hypothetical protein
MHLIGAIWHAGIANARAVRLLFRFACDEEEAELGVQQVLSGQWWSDKSDEPRDSA